MASSQPSLVTSHPNSAAGAHFHVGIETCPLCEQPIPHDRADEIAERLEALEHQREAELTARLESRFEAEKIEALAKAEEEAIEKLAAARQSARAEAEIESKAAVAAAEAAKQSAEAEKAKAETERAEAQSRLARANEEKETAVAEAKRAADAAAALRISEVEERRQAAEEASASLQNQLGDIRRAHAERIELMNQDAAFREAEIRREVKEAAAQESREALNAAKAEAAAVQEQLANKQQEHEKELAAQREALEAARTNAVNAEKSASFEERLKLQAQVDKLKRDLEQKSVDELGEGAHIDLLEALKSEFSEDRIDRIPRGLPGADIRHTIIHNGKACGTILYDSKNHAAWRNEFVTKLKSDQLADKADHAVLVTSKFPAGKRNVCVQDSVIVSSPMQVVALIQIVRKHMVQAHALRMSNAERARKTGELYAFITSPRCGELLTRIESDAAKLLELQANEKRQHDLHWNKQGQLLCAIQKSRGDLCFAIDSIIGTADEEEAR